MQEQLQAERDLRAALEVGLSMSSGQFSSSRGMDSKVCSDLTTNTKSFLCILPLLVVGVPSRICVTNSYDFTLI